jgi:bifunctional diaminopimelate decarboxylase / aspartate kinase
MNVKSEWIVLKFGGTSVSSANNWRNIQRVVKAREAEGHRILIVHSALSGVTDLLEQLLASAARGDHKTNLNALHTKHALLARELGIELPEGFLLHFAALEKILSGIALVGEVSDRTRARVMASGELMATEVGAAFLRVTWLDARSVLQSTQRADATERANILSATCDASPNEHVHHTLEFLSGTVLTQGFIANDVSGHTVLLGRGGSDTSGAYFAALLHAKRLEIWTDVPGMFSANPKDVPTARLLKELHYDEAQEIASSGAKVLHPRCIMPVRVLGIPISVHDTQHPELPGTRISNAPPESGARVKAIAIKKGITLVSMESPGMWHQVGFLADAFSVFKAHGISIDLVSTSETNVTVSLDPAANALTPEAIRNLLSSLSSLCKASLLGPCASLSLVGRNIRGILHKLGEALELFEEHKVYLVSQAANDLSFTLVLDEAQGDRLIGKLHDLLIRAKENDRVLGPSWENLHAKPSDNASTETWWETKRLALLDVMTTRDAAYVYDLQTVRGHARAVRGISSVTRVFYALKANANPSVLRAIVEEGVGLECVSQGEVLHARESVPLITNDQILFTPNFAPRAEYAWALSQGLRVTIDNVFILKHWGDLLQGREVFLRIDTGVGKGHHEHVRTAGKHSKFGIPLFELEEAAALAAKHSISVTGLHAHAGSGIFDPANWRETADTLAEVTKRFPNVRVLDLGGGLGVPDRREGAALDLVALGNALQPFKEANPQFELWLEPGRFLVATAGVLLAKVTQLKGKGDVHYAGIATGMNSLIRPALYGAYHAVSNLTRHSEARTSRYTVVGPICESGDQVGQDRSLPPSQEGDVFLIENAGAYGFTMSSFYNRREPAEEVAV